MRQKTFFWITGIVFTILAVISLLRVIFRWNAVINEFAIPIWISVSAVIIAGFLAFSSFRFLKKI
ncbi:hypothetical protein HYV49_02265 [Candidatus Pacearchaeota archaeon]|nr:hypothetical protein [Candidatus Pacearchaeota archaeon]